jgi:hypothetical protein
MARIRKDSFSIRAIRSSRGLKIGRLPQNRVGAKKMRFLE